MPAACRIARLRRLNVRRIVRPCLPSLDVLAVLGSGILPTPEPTLGKVFPRVKQGQQVQARKAHEQVPAAKFELGQLVATLVHRFRLLSSYRLRNGVKVWVITEADRSSTTLLLPDEY
jgi:hypothetical protein